MPATEFVLGQTSEHRPVIERELQCVLRSEFFARSPRSASFLRHIVDASLSGKSEDLKERRLGIEIFGRDPAYDTGDDAIVRVTANEVRRRLAQFNSQRPSGQAVRIELPAGSYVPRFYLLASPETGPFLAASPLRRPLVWIAVATVLLIALLAGLIFLRRPSALEQFWQPVVANPRPAMICLGHPLVYVPSQPPGTGSAVLKFSPRDSLGTNMIPASDQFVGVGDAQAGFLLGNFLKGLHKRSEMRLGSQVSFSDLQDFPVILIGAFSNRWTMQISNQFRFVFREDGDSGNRRVVDRRQPGRSWRPPFFGAAGRVTEDFAIISRVIRSKSGQIMISAAGITQYGSQAAGELLSNPQLFSKAVVDAPPGWAKKNLQIIVKTEIFNGSPGPPEVVATHFW